MKSLGCAIVALSILFAIPVSAQEAGGGGEAIINAVAYRPLPADTSFKIQALDDSWRSVAAIEELEQKLRQSGRTTALRAPLVLTLDVREVTAAWSDGGRRTVLELQGSGDGITGHNHRLRLNLFDSSAGGIFNEGQGERGTNVVTRGRHRIEATVDDSDSGHRLWQGWIEAGTERQDDLALIRAMIAPLVDHLGATVRRQAVELP